MLPLDHCREKDIQKDAQLIGEILGQIYRDKRLYRCLCESVVIRPERLRLLYQVVMNYDRMPPEAIREKVYRYGNLIEDEELLARQMFLWLVRLLETVEKSNGEVTERKMDAGEAGSAMKIALFCLVRSKKMVYYKAECNR